MIAKYMAEVERRQVGDIGEFCHVPFASTAPVRRLPSRAPARASAGFEFGIAGRFTVAHRFERQVEEIEPERLGLECHQPPRAPAGPTSRLRSIMALAGSRPCDVRVSLSLRANCSGAKFSPNRKVMARSPIAAGKADPERRIGGKEYGVARRADDMPAGRVMLRKHAADRQCDRIQVLPLDVAARGGCRTGLERADLQRRAFKQCFTADFQGLDPGILTQVHAADILL